MARARGTKGLTHISPNVGPRACDAEPGECPWEHYDTPEEAQAVYTRRLEEEHGIMPSVSAVSATPEPTDSHAESAGSGRTEPPQRRSMSKPLASALAGDNAATVRIMAQSDPKLTELDNNIGPIQMDELKLLATGSTEDRSNLLALVA